MDHRAHALVASLLLALGAPAWAGYAQLSPPSGWASGGGAGGSFAAAANSETFAGGVRSTATLNAGGRVVQVPAAMRFAANAGRFAGRAIFLNPALAGAVGLAWLASQCLAHQGGQWVLTCGDTSVPQADGWQYRAANITSLPWSLTCDAASTAMAAAMETTTKRYTVRGPCINFAAGAPSSPSAPSQNGNAQLWEVDKASGAQAAIAPQIIRVANAACPAGWYVTSAGCVQNAPPRTVTQQEFEDKLAPQPIPDGLPRELPGVPLPIDLPKVNPTPGTNPQPQPLWIPQGDPQPIPNTDPRQYEQPGTRVQPAPTPQSPWQVDLQPENRTGTDPTGVRDPITPGASNPDAEKPEQDLCEKNPDIIACQKLEFDAPVPDELETKNLGGNVTPDSGWGASSAACPAPRHLSVQGRDIPIPYDLFCQYMAGIRPIVIAMAWLAAAFILLGVRAGDD